MPVVRSATVLQGRAVIDVKKHAVSDRGCLHPGAGEVKQQRVDEDIACGLRHQGVERHGIAEAELRLALPIEPRKILAGANVGVQLRLAGAQATGSQATQLRGGKVGLVEGAIGKGNRMVRAVDNEPGAATRAASCPRWFAWAADWVNADADEVQGTLSGDKAGMRVSSGTGNWLLT